MVSISAGSGCCRTAREFRAMGVTSEDGSSAFDILMVLIEAAKGRSSPDAFLRRGGRDTV